jgi:hypothetical protein
MTNAVTGYGSLISRASFSARFTEELVEEGIVGEDELVELGAVEDEEELEEYARKLEQVEEPDEAVDLLADLHGAEGLDALVEANVLRDEEELEKYQEMVRRDEPPEETAKKMALESTIRKETNSAYDTAPGYDEMRREKADTLWSELTEEQEVLPVPVKFPGMRGYWFESSRGGTMTTADRSEEEEMNGVVYIGVSDEQQDAIEADEGESYRMLELDWDELEMYAPDRAEELMEERGMEPPETVKVFYTNNFGSKINKQSARTMNERYQEGIKQAVENQMAELYGEDVAEEFLDDFNSSTYVNPVPGAPTSFNDEIEAALHAVFPEIAGEYMERQDREVKQFANTVEQQRRAIQAYDNLFN